MTDPVYPTQVPDTSFRHRRSFVTSFYDTIVRYFQNQRLKKSRPEIHVEFLTFKSMIVVTLTFLLISDIKSSK